MSTKPLEFEKPIIELENELESLRSKSLTQKIDMTDEIAAMEQILSDTRNEIYSNLSSWQRVQIARHTNRPFMLDYVYHAFEDFCELHGDRHIGDDHSMPGGFARIGGEEGCGDWSSEGERYEREFEAKFWECAS